MRNGCTVLEQSQTSEAKAAFDSLSVRPLMTLSEQVAILLETAELELLQPEDIVRWADKVIVAMDKPPVWVVDLSMLRSPHLIDFIGLLRLHADVPVTLRRRFQIVVLAHITGVLPLADTLPKLFRVAIVEHQGARRDALDARLADALVDWDFQEELSVIEPSLRARFDALFREYLTDVQDVAAVLAWKYDNVVNTPPER